MIELAGIEKGIAAAILTVVALWLLKPLAQRLDLLDYPKGRKDHARPTPVTGGLAMGVGAIAIGLTTVVDVGASFRGFMVAALLLIGVGLLDDKYDLRWYWRILAQVIAALIMVYWSGVRVEQLGPAFGVHSLSLGWLSVPFTVFATVGLINAINMVDGVDGLAGLLVAAALLMLLAAAMYSGNGIMSERLVVLLGAVLAFLVFNMRLPWQPRAKLFMGNAGSAFLGFVIAWCSFRLSQNPHHPINPALVLWFVPIPVMDTLVLMFRRVRQGRSPFAADRNHIHHLMLDAGFTPSQVGLVLAAFTLMCGLIAGVAMRVDVPTPLLLVAFGVLCVGWFVLTRKRRRAIRFFRGLCTPVQTWRRVRAARPETVPGSD